MARFVVAGAGHMAPGDRPAAGADTLRRLVAWGF